MRVDLNAKLVSYGNAPGDRSVNLVSDVEELGGGAKARLDLNVSAEDSARVRAQINDVHRLAWQGKGPIDRQDGEQRPTWL